MATSRRAPRPRSKRPTPRAPRAPKAGSGSRSSAVVGCPVLTLPADVLALVLPFLAWRATDAMTRVCSSWRALVLAAKARGAQWRASVLGPAASAAESLRLLRANHGGWADTRFAPNLALLAVASADSRPWQSGAYWDELVAALESERLLPRACRVVATFTTLAVLGGAPLGDATPDAAAQHPAVTLSVSVAHLPGTSVEAACFDRKTLRRCHRDVDSQLDDVFSSVGPADEPSFLLFGVNDQSASELVPAIQRWHPGAVVMGAVSPLLDRCMPLATYVDDAPSCSGCASSHDATDLRTKHQGRKEKQDARRQRRRRSSAASRRGRLEFPSTLLLRLCGQVGVRAFASSGYDAVTPVLQCHGVDADRMYSQAVHYDRVSLGASPSSDASQHRLLDLVVPSERVSIEQDNRSVNLYACRECEPLQWLVPSSRVRSSATSAARSALDGAQILRLEDVLCLADGIASLQRHWEEGAFGFLAAHFPDRAHSALAVALRDVRERVDAEKGAALGAFVAAGALSEMEALDHAEHVRRLYAEAFEGLPLGGCVVSSAVGPVALPGGLNTSEAAAATAIAAQVQVHTTCGAVFYERER